MSAVKGQLAVVFALCLLMVVCPLLSPAAGRDGEGALSSLEITRPLNSLYLFDLQVMPLPGTVVVGAVTVEAEGGEDIVRVEFRVPPVASCVPVVVYDDSHAPFAFLWEESSDFLKDRGLVNLMAWGYTGEGLAAKDDLFLMRLVM
ncbi:MAG: hypothetical protein PHU95_05375 [Candidatus Thermoplasmatota archaeon]|nr:hypothetical protein [Candidatus Thermoplasmatota archaeon]MDD5778856.1 hypothetical protein [Candidatus Thermoplasmatota archaeon]